MSTEITPSEPEPTPEQKKQLIINRLIRITKHFEANTVSPHHLDEIRTEIMRFELMVRMAVIQA